MSSTKTSHGYIGHHKHHLGFLCPVKTLWQRKSDEPPSPVIRKGENGEKMYVFAIPGGGELLIPEKGVKITKEVKA